MIGKITIGKDFYGVLAYNEKKVREGVGYVIDSNIEHSTSVNMTTEFNLIRELRPGLGKAVFHVSLNLPHSDYLNDKEFALFGCDYLMKMGFDNNQFIMYRHTDTRHEHIHIVANRVRYSGRITSDSNIRRRSREVLIDLEKKYGLTQVLGKTGAKKSLTQKEIEKSFRTGQAPIKLMLQQKLDNALVRSSDVSQFINELKQGHIIPKFNVSKTTGRVTGISFKYEDVIYKGSSLGRQYSWNNIVKHIDYEQNRDCAIILKNNEGSGGISKNNSKDNNPSIGNNGKTGSIKEGTRGIDKKSKYYLAKTQANGPIGNQEDDYIWTPFKLELEERGRKKKKKRRRKGKTL